MQELSADLELRAPSPEPLRSEPEPKKQDSSADLELRAPRPEPPRSELEPNKFRIPVLDWIFVLLVPSLPGASPNPKMQDSSAYVELRAPGPQPSWSDSEPDNARFQC